ncbi:hypothetical protein [Streptomyces sp. NPDC001978]|uniref:hypothetical protein n=1 Tax=Streptomyces sp. NPDC001978 TaxID=3364627 RepID=UPI0036BA8D18
MPVRPPAGDIWPLSVDVQGGQGHGAVDVHGYVGGEAARAAQLGEFVQDDLGAVEGERGDDDSAAPGEVRCRTCAKWARPASSSWRRLP